MGGGPSTPPKEGMTPAHILFPFGHWPFAGPPVIMTCPGLSWAVLCGRAERIPPRKRPSTLSKGFPRKAIRPWLAHPAEGRAPHARKESITLTPTLPLLATGPPTRGSRWPRPVCARPCFSDAETASLRENRLPRCLRAFPARPSHTG